MLVVGLFDDFGPEVLATFALPESKETGVGVIAKAEARRVEQALLLGEMSLFGGNFPVKIIGFYRLGGISGFVDTFAHFSILCFAVIPRIKGETQEGFEKYFQECKGLTKD
jgi:hypothetical protein